MLVQPLHRQHERPPALTHGNAPAKWAGPPRRWVCELGRLAPHRARQRGAVQPLRRQMDDHRQPEHRSVQSHGDAAPKRSSPRRRGRMQCRKPHLLKRLHPQRRTVRPFHWQVDDHRKSNRYPLRLRSPQPRREGPRRRVASSDEHFAIFGATLLGNGGEIHL